MRIAACGHIPIIEPARPSRGSLNRRLQDALPLILNLAATLGLALLPTTAAADALRVDSKRGEVRVAATIHPDRFQGALTRHFGMPGYHLLAWEKGGAAGNALLTTPVGDRALHAALIAAGASPGNALGMDTWEARRDSHSRAPEKVIEGTPIWIGLHWAGRADPVPLAELLEDPGGKGFEFRFGGHLANIPIWKSGCGICLYSCPGAKIGNAAYTVRDYVDETTRFRIRAGRLPPKGASVDLVCRLQAPPEP